MRARGGRATTAASPSALRPGPREVTAVACPTRVAVPKVSAGTLRKARKVQDRYAALRLDLTDAVNVVLAEAYDTESILTLDRRNFRAITPLTGTHAFRLLPDDL